MKLAHVILDIPTQALDVPYTYAVPEEGLFAAACEGAGDEEGADAQCDYAVAVGAAVLVPFGHRRAIGFVVDIREYGQPGGPDWPAEVDPAKLKAIVRAVSRPYFDEEGAACAQWLSERYIAPLSACVRLFTPPGGVARMVRGRDGRWRLEQPAVGEVDDRWVVPGPALAAFSPRKNAVKQAQVVEALRGGELRVAELAAQFGAVSSVLKALEAKDVVRVVRRRRMRGVRGAASGPVTDCNRQHVLSAKPALTAGQATALSAIERACDAGCGRVVLVDGVTGSGKTEVYLQAIERVLAQGRTACVLVPEISLTPQTVGRFRGRFGDTVAVMHSRMSAGERFDQWDFIRSRSGGRAQRPVHAACQHRAHRHR